MCCVCSAVLCCDKGFRSTSRARFCFQAFLVQEIVVVIFRAVTECLLMSLSSLTPSLPKPLVVWEVKPAEQPASTHRISPEKNKRAVMHPRASDSLICVAFSCSPEGCTYLNPFLVGLEDPRANPERVLLCPPATSKTSSVIKKKNKYIVRTFCPIVRLLSQ